ncbi:MAG: DPP IV N-terminal domain-containing protein [Bacteroidota bacterium]|jgi:dipeptidyl-peptidase-4
MRRICAAFAFCLIASVSLAQNKLLTVEDAVMKQRTALAPERLSQLAFIPGTHWLSWVGKKDNRECLIVHDIPSGKNDTVLHIDKLKEMVESTNTGVPKFERFPFIKWINKDVFRFMFSNVYYEYATGKNDIKVLNRLPAEAENAEIDPNGSNIAFVQNNNVYVYNPDTWNKIEQQKNVPATNTKNGIEKPEYMITDDGSYVTENGKSVHRSEFGITKGLFWSPKGTRIAYYKQQQGMVTDYALLKTEKVPASYEYIKYPFAGAQSHMVWVYMYDTKRKITYPIYTKGPADQYLTNITFSPDEEQLYIAIVNREQNTLQLNKYDATTGAFIKTMFTESHTKYIEPETPILFVKNKPTQFVWQSERDGFNHLYLYNYKGEMERQLTKGNFDVKEIIGFDADGNYLYYMATANNGLDRQCYKVDVSSGKTTSVTSIPGTHTVLISDDDKYVVDQFSSTAVPRRIVLREQNGNDVRILLNANNPLSAYMPVGMRLLQITAADGKTTLNGRMFYPSKMDSAKKYPVLVYVYGGPHAQMITNTWLGGADMWLYYMAQQGYLVFTVDNRGSANRGLEFEQATYRNLGKAERDDQLAGIEYLKKLKYVDASRIGVFGWSFGGFMSIGLMTRTDAYKVGVAGGPVIDWRWYEIMYTERYMDKPEENPEGYADADLTNYVKNLKGKLLVIHGTDDDVVVWQHSLKYVKKCIDENVQVDYFVYPGHKHNVVGKDRVHLMQKVADYFKVHL